MISFLSSPLYKVRQFLTGDKLTPGKMGIFIVCALVITYFLTPNYSYQKLEYRENDIALNDIVAEEAFLLIDEKATLLKKQNLLKNQSLFFDFDSEYLKKLSADLEITFSDSRKKLAEISEESSQLSINQRQIDSNIILNYSKIHQEKNRIQDLTRLLDAANEEIKKLIGNRANKDSQKFAEIRYAQIKTSVEFSKKVIEQLTSEIEKLDEEKKELSLKMQETLKALEDRKQKIIRDFATSFGLILSEEDSKNLLENAFSSTLQKFLADSLVFAGEYRVIDHKLLEEYSTQNQFYIRSNGTDDEFTTVKREDIYTGEELSGIILSDNVYGSRENNSTIARLVRSLLPKLLRPNLTPDENRMKENRDKIIGDTSAVYISLDKGQLIAERGKRIDQKTADLINQYYMQLERINVWPLSIGIFILTLGMFGMIRVSFKRIFLETQKNYYKPLLIIAIILAVHVALNYYFTSFIQSVSLFNSGMRINLVGFYLMPLALASVITVILVGFEISVLVTIASGIFTVLISSAYSDIFYLFYAIISGLITSYLLGKNTSRIDLLLQGMKAALFCLPVILLIQLFNDQPFEAPWHYYLLAPFVGCLSSAILCLFLYPLFETLFDITTDLKLLELSNINHPALRKLLAKAPGTYQHSIMVGNLAEAAALKVGANSLLVKVASYYHDIGKSVNPQYFIENVQRNESNIHDKLDNPEQSAKVIIDHVTNGVEMAREYNLGSAITEIIREHHGTMTVGYFYVSAQKKARNVHGDNYHLAKTDFRYRGPKPRTVESAIVMLADGCEAATRSLANPTKENIEATIAGIARSILNERQMEDSGISLRDFQTTLKVFSEMLINLYHKRVTYPELDTDLSISESASSLKSIRQSKPSVKPVGSS